MQQEDPRKLGLKTGLRQLNIEQLYRVLNYKDEMVLDTYQYLEENGKKKFCPLAIALEFDKIISNPSNDKIVGMLLLLGYKIWNTKNISGEFYTNNRAKDLLIALKEVIEEKETGDKIENYAATE